MERNDMNPISKQEIQQSLVNVTKSERNALTVPSQFDKTDWEKLDFYGWRDPKPPQRGYLVRQLQDAAVSVAVATTGGGLTPGRKAMCVICHAVDNASAISLFVAKKTGAAGRSGNTVGTYICSDLDCSMQLRSPGNRLGRSRLGTAQDADQAAVEMLERLDSFLLAIQTE